MYINKIILIIFLLFCIGCDEEITVTGPLSNILQQTTNSMQVMSEGYDYDVVCNEFGVVYYKSYIHGGNYVYTPIFSDQPHPVVTCEEYVKYLSTQKEKNNGKRSFNHRER